MKPNKMKFILIFLCVLITSSVHATDYFFSNAGNNSNSGTSSSTPWATLSKLATTVLVPGDKVLLNSGDVFTVPAGGITITQSGTSVNHIVFSSYGTGAKPIITSLATVSGWTNIATGIWESNSAVNSLASLSIVTIDGQVYAMGRYPNLNTTNKGYIKYTSVGAKNSVNPDTIGFPSTVIPTFTGGELVIRSIRSRLDRCIVVSQTSTQVIYNEINSSHIVPQVNYSFFFQNHPTTLDQFGEWYYNTSNNKLRVFFGSAGPTGIAVKASTEDTTFWLPNGKSYIDFSGLTIEGANINAILMNHANHITISNCDITDIGKTGIESENVSTFVTITGCNITWCNNVGVDLPLPNASASNSLLNSTISDIGMFAGMGTSEGNSGSYNGVQITGRSNAVINNVIKNIGYNGIYYYFADSIQIKNNTISHYCSVVNDGGGIYTGNNTSVIVTRPGQVISHNIILNANTSNEGTIRPNGKAGGGSQGIYFDNWTSLVTVDNNTVYDANSGLYLHNSTFINAHDNTYYACWEGSERIFEDTGNAKDLADPRMANLILKKNILFAKDTDQLALSISTVFGNFDGFGVSDSNYYCRPIFEPDGLNASTSTGGVIKAVTSSSTLYQSLDVWKGLHSYDAHTVKTYLTTDDTAKIRFEYNASLTPINVSLGGATYQDAIGNTYPGIITLAPFTSAVLIKVADAGTVGFASSTYNAFESLRKVKITVSLSAIASTDVRVNVVTANGTALAGSDYTAMNKLLVIKAGTLSRTFCVPIVQDGTAEPAQTFTITLSNPINAILSTTTTTVTISD